MRMCMAYNGGWLVSIHCPTGNCVRRTRTCLTPRKR